MADVKLYSTGCPKCNVLKKKLDAAGIEYDVITDMNVIEEVCNGLGVDTLPILGIDANTWEKYMEFSSAIKWVGEQTNAD